MANWQTQYVSASRNLHLQQHHTQFYDDFNHSTIASEHWNEAFQKKCQKGNWKDPSNLKYMHDL